MSEHTAEILIDMANVRAWLARHGSDDVSISTVRTWCRAGREFLPPLVARCEALVTERDALRAELDRLAGRVAELEGIVRSLSARCAGQSELLAKRAESPS